MLLLLALADSEAELFPVEFWVATAALRPPFYVLIVIIFLLITFICRVPCVDVEVSPPPRLFVVTTLLPSVATPRSIEFIVASRSLRSAELATAELP